MITVDYWMTFRRYVSYTILFFLFDIVTGSRIKGSYNKPNLGDRTTWEKTNKPVWDVHYYQTTKCVNCSMRENQYNNIKGSTAKMVKTRLAGDQFVCFFPSQLGKSLISIVYNLE